MFEPDYEKRNNEQSQPVYQDQNLQLSQRTETEKADSVNYSE